MNIRLPNSCSIGQFSHCRTLTLFCLNIDIHYEVITLYSHSIKADSDYTLQVLLVFSVKRYRPNKIASDWFDFVRLVQKSNSQQNICLICSIAEANQTPIVRSSSIGFLFDFVWLDAPGQHKTTTILCWK